MKGQKFAVVDIETTGSRPGKDKIIEIAIAVVENGVIINRYERLLDPECPIPSNITYLTGIKQHMVEGKPRFFEIAKDIVDITQDCIFVAHNVRFDYSFIREEFRSLGFTYSKKTLCTVRLSRKAFPDIPKHSLGYLIKHFNIEVESRHRAMADVLATVDVLNRVQDMEAQSGHIEELISMGIKESLLPLQVTKAMIQELPDEPGVYFMLDENGKAVYIGKSVNIRSRVASHFSKKSKKASDLQKAVHRINYELTGSDLMAAFVESLEIKKQQPRINRAQKQVRYPYHLHLWTDEEGYKRFMLSKKKKETGSYQYLASFASKAGMYAKLRKILEDYELCSKLMGLSTEFHMCFNHQIGRCKGACCGQEDVAPYNERVEESIDKLSQELEGSFIVFEKGRKDKEDALILVLDGRISAYGWLDKEENSFHQILELKDALNPLEETAELRYILRRYLHSKGRKRIKPIPYSPV